MIDSIILRYGTDFERLSETLLDYCVKDKDSCKECPFTQYTEPDERCPIDSALAVINKIYIEAETDTNDDNIPTCPF